MDFKNRPLIKYSLEDLEKEVKLIEAGATYRDVSKQLCIPLTTIHSHINSHMRNHYPELFNRVCKAYASRKGKGQHFGRGYRV